MGGGIPLRGGITATLNAQTVIQTMEHEIASTRGQKQLTHKRLGLQKPSLSSLGESVNKH